KDTKKPLAPPREKYVIGWRRLLWGKGRKDKKADASAQGNGGLALLRRRSECYSAHDHRDGHAATARYLRYSSELGPSKSKSGSLSPFG
ncbi:MAG TPA: hypothetical protein PLU38_10315, partial [Kiritimatiellia bacterium]|nr:hypothetical protein [Kiritimatiellia bacterium]HQQ92245.1 hypothetical protein [Kiritimatiellia bacterium]